MALSEHDVAAVQTVCEMPTAGKTRNDKTKATSASKDKSHRQNVKEATVSHKAESAHRSVSIVLPATREGRSNFKVREWAAELAANHRAALPALIKTHEDLGNFIAHLLTAYLAGQIERPMYQDLLVGAMTFLQNAQAAKGQKLAPMLVVRRP